MANTCGIAQRGNGKNEGKGETITSEIGDIVGVVALIVSIFNVYLYHRHSKKTIAVALKHEVTPWPPHLGPGQSIEVRVRNVGSARAKMNTTTLRFSWNTPEIVLDWEKKLGGPQYLAPKEDQAFETKIPPPEKEGEYRITITTTYDDGKGTKTEEFWFQYYGPHIDFL